MMGVISVYEEGDPSPPAVKDMSEIQTAAAMQLWLKTGAQPFSTHLLGEKQLTPLQRLTVDGNSDGQVLQGKGLSAALNTGNVFVPQETDAEMGTRGIVVPLNSNSGLYRLSEDRRTEHETLLRIDHGLKGNTLAMRVLLENHEVDRFLRHLEAPRAYIDKARALYHRLLGACRGDPNNYDLPRAYVLRTPALRDANNTNISWDRAYIVNPELLESQTASPH